MREPMWLSAGKTEDDPGLGITQGQCSLVVKSTEVQSTAARFLQNADIFFLCMVFFWSKVSKFFL